MAQRVARDHPGVTWWCPQLPMSPRQAMDRVQQGIRDWPRQTMAVVGSSLGGFYATWLAEQSGCKTVLLNPAVFAARDLATQIGSHAAWHDPSVHLVFEPGFVDELRAMETGGPTQPQRYYLLAAKGDEVLDWQEMIARYPGVQLRLLDGIDHGLSDFAVHLDDVMRFMDLV